MLSDGAPTCKDHQYGRRSTNRHCSLLTWLFGRHPKPTAPFALSSRQTGKAAIKTRHSTAFGAKRSSGISHQRLCIAPNGTGHARMSESSIYLLSSSSDRQLLPFHQIAFGRENYNPGRGFREIPRGNACLLVGVPILIGLSSGEYAVTPRNGAHRAQVPLRGASGARPDHVQCSRETMHRLVDSTANRIQGPENPGRRLKSASSRSFSANCLVIFLGCASYPY
jgi:hypothetical protein